MSSFAKPVSWGALASAAMLAVFFGVVGLVSGWTFALEQFAAYWYFILPSALGFGIQIGLYRFIKQLAGRLGGSGKVVAASGTMSTAAMVSCCAHYLINILPILGVTAFVALVAQFQVELFWLGLAFNFAGILYIAPKAFKA